MGRPTLSKVLAALAAAAVVATVASGAAKEPAVSPLAREPAFCNRQAVRTLVDDFIRAFNAGNARALQEAWVGVRFQWYSETAPGRDGRLRTNAHFTRRSLLRYLAERHLRGERLQLKSLRFVGFSSAWGRFAFAVRRRADDVAGGRWQVYRGIGAASCLRRPEGLGSWSMIVSA